MREGSSRPSSKTLETRIGPDFLGPEGVTGRIENNFPPYRCDSLNRTGSKSRGRPGKRKGGLTSQ